MDQAGVAFQRPAGFQPPPAGGGPGGDVEAPHHPDEAVVGLGQQGGADPEGHRLPLGDG